MSFKNLFTSDYLFRVNGVLNRFDKVYLIIGGIFILLALVLGIAAKLSPRPVDKKYRFRLFNLFLTIGLLEVLWYGMRFQNIRFFGSHFFAWLIFLAGLVWFGFIAVSMFKHYKEEKEKWEKEQVKLKYLPK